MFENQLFISYSHIDNDHPSRIEKGWVDLLHEALNRRLAQLLGKPVKIWRDPKLRGNDVFNDTIVIELSRTAVLISVLSPRYLLSQPCRKELEDFLHFAAMTGGIPINNKHRVFKVMKTPTPLEDHPAGLEDMLGYEFYSLDQSSGRFREYEHEIGPQGEKDRRFWDRFEDLAQDICFLLKQMANGQRRAHEPAPNAALYLAETTSDLAEERNKIRRELQQYGHTVLPDKPLPSKPEPLQAAVRGYLGRSRLSIHLIGEFYDTILRLQHELAVERDNDSEFSRLIWMPPDLQPKDAVQRQFIAELHNSFTSKNSSELLQTKLEDFRTIIQANLNNKESTPSVTEDKTGDIYLICDKLDLSSVKPLYNYLLIDEGFRVKLSVTEGKSSRVHQDRKENLLRCDAVLIFFGSVGDNWLAAQFDELRKVRGYGREKPFFSIAIYVAAPRTDQKELLESKDLLILKTFADFTPESVAPFVKQFREAKGTLR